MKKITLFLALLVGYLPLVAQIANDICNTAITLPLGYNCLELDDLNGTMTGATDEGYALPSCADGPAFRNDGNFDVWYAFTAPPTGKVLFRIFNRGFIDEAVVYSGTCNTLTEVICLNGVRDPTIFQLSPNANYYLRLDKSYAPEQTSEEFCLQLTEVPTNDICSGATPLTIGAACDGTFFNGDNRSTILEAPIKKCDGVESIYLLDTWYSFEAPLSGRVVVKLTSQGTENPPDFRVYQGACSALEEIYCGQGHYNVDSIILVNPGTTYFIQTLASETDGPYCIWVKEQISFDNLFYGVKVETGFSGTPTELDYDQTGAPTAIELEEMGACDQTAFARVEPAGVIKIKAIAPRCVEDSNTGKEPGVSAEGHWSISRYRLVGLTEDVIPVTFTFEFSGFMNFTPKDGNQGIQGSFGFIYGFLTADDYIQDYGKGLFSKFGDQEVEYSFDNLKVNEATIAILPEIDDGNQTYDVQSIMPAFISAYNALPAADKNNPNLTLSTNFLTAIDQPVDVTLWTTAFQSSLKAEANNFLAALDHLGFDSQLGYNANAVTVTQLNYKHVINYDYQRTLTVLIDNADFSSLPSIWFNGKVEALNIDNPYTVITDFSNTGRIGSITVPEEHLLDRDIHALQIGTDISIPIEVTGCTDSKLLLPELPIASREFTSSDTITAKSIIESGNEVVFKSEKIVVLAPGFHAQAGSQLSVEIGEVPDCNVAPLTTEEDIGEMRISLSEEATETINGKELDLAVYPNPFTSTTTIDYYLPVSAPVTIKVIDLFGQEKAMLLEGSHRDAGSHQLTYRPDNISYGTYLIVLQSGATVKMQKLLLIKE